uniref:Uncharacterized protein n=1 Tax=Spongospora subterranea TaxID=70186 RepID=A0A0H5RB99_9EUKA|eukprot:CRZ11485.1 hypothetical protein [Spongospora subterranea]
MPPKFRTLPDSLRAKPPRSTKRRLIMNECRDRSETVEQISAQGVELLLSDPDCLILDPVFEIRHTSPNTSPQLEKPHQHSNNSVCQTDLDVSILKPDSPVSDRRSQLFVPNPGTDDPYRDIADQQSPRVNFPICGTSPDPDSFSSPKLSFNATSSLNHNISQTIPAPSLSCSSSSSSSIDVLTSVISPPQFSADESRRILLSKLRLPPLGLSSSIPIAPSSGSETEDDDVTVDDELPTVDEQSPENDVELPIDDDIPGPSSIDSARFLQSVAAFVPSYPVSPFKSRLDRGHKKPNEPFQEARRKKGKKHSPST